jgi:2-oxoglutarate ferredoxin oxidoreductase subunit delta
MASVRVDRDRCKGCELCVSVCPQKILGMSEAINTKGYFFAEVKDAERCIGCMICALMCPDVAIAVFGNGVQYRLFEYFPASSTKSRQP